MSEADDRDSKTEEPTQKKIDDAEEKGNTPLSRELPLFASVLALIGAGYFLMPKAAFGMTAGLALILEKSGAWRLETAVESTHVLAVVSTGTLLALLPLVLAITGAGLLGSLLQNPPRLAGERIRPQVTRISPVKGWSRIFGLAGFVEFAKSAFKLFAVTAAVAFVAAGELPGLLRAMMTDAALIPEAMLGLAIRLLAAAAVAAALLAAADFAWSRFSWRRNLRMSRHEVKEETKQQDGDPHLKAHRRNLARRKAAKRMMASVPKATLVVTNPTHIAVALRYVREEGGAPLVVAKGAGHLAKRIREIAERHKIPVLEDKPLARALHSHVGVGSMIPPEFYQAVAQLIHVLRGARRPSRA